jgi:CubicO group peptidase (beta-lactamase class C family)
MSPVIKRDILSGAFVELMKEHGVPGISAIIRLSDGTAIYDIGGKADIYQGFDLHFGSYFPIASLTKVFAAVIVLQLHDEHTLLLSDYLLKYGINMVGMEQVTIEDLLTHTSRKTFKYSDRRYYVLEKVLNKATGDTFGQLLKKRILDPLQLKYIIPCTMLKDGINPYITQRLVRPYVYEQKTFRDIGSYPTFFGVNDGLVANLYELSTFFHAIERLLSEKMLTLFYTNRITAAGEMIPYGRGIFVQQKGNLKIAWHFGCTKGFSSIAVKLPALGLTAILLANSSNMCQSFFMENGDATSSPFTVALLDYLTGRVAL